MQRKSVTRLLSALLCLALVAGAVFSLARAKRRDAGSVPIQVLCSPSTITAGSKTQITVTLNGVTVSNQSIGLSYAGYSFKNDLGYSGSSFKRGPQDPVTGFSILGGNSSGSCNSTIPGNSGDVVTVTASCNGYEASGTVTLQ
ncbi:MAG TPA: hypothetical protein VGL56_01695 [Fimbriimonadaceae bacterium]|jgi:hypothetical protein